MTLPHAHRRALFLKLGVQSRDWKCSGDIGCPLLIASLHLLVSHCSPTSEQHQHGPQTGPTGTQISRIPAYPYPAQRPRDPTWRSVCSSRIDPTQSRFPRTSLHSFTFLLRHTCSSVILLVLDRIAPDPCGRFCLYSSRSLEDGRPAGHPPVIPSTGSSQPANSDPEVMVPAQRRLAG
jgi:hypothetical protein